MDKDMVYRRFKSDLQYCLYTLITDDIGSKQNITMVNHLVTQQC